MRSTLCLLCLIAWALPSGAQPVGKFPPDSLLNTHVIPKSTPVMEVIGMMRNMSFALGVRRHSNGLDSAPGAR